MTARSITASAWSRGRLLITSIAASVVSASATRTSRSTGSRDLDPGEVLVGADAPGAGAQEVERAMAADGRDPASEAVGVAAEPVEVAHGLAPGLGGDVLGVVATDEHLEVAQQGCLHAAIDEAECLRIARAHALDGSVERPLTGHRLPWFHANRHLWATR